MDIRLSFDAVPDVYDRARPTYPSDLVELILAGLGPTPQVLEMGPGTGQLTAMLLERNARVTAVELGSNLAGFLEHKFSEERRLTVLNDSFESAPVELGSFDAVVAATAYHWVADEAKTERPAELLRSGGVLGIIDLLQVDSVVDRGYFARVTPIYERYGAAKRDPHRTHETAQPPMAQICRDSDWFRSVVVHRERWDQTYTSNEYRDLLWSYSGTQMTPEPKRSQLVDELVAVIDDEFNGTVTRPLAATLTLATRI